VDPDATLKRNLDETSRVMGEFHPYTRTALGNLVTWLIDKNDHSQAESYARRFWESIRTERGRGNFESLRPMEIYARLLQGQDRHREAEPVLRELVQSRIAIGAGDSLTQGLSLQAHGLALTECGGNLDEAERILRQSVDILQRRGSPHTQWMTAVAENTLGGCLIVRHKYKEAERCLNNSYKIVMASPTAQIGKTRALERMIKLYEAWGKPELANEWRAKRAGAPVPGSK